MTEYLAIDIKAASDVSNDLADVVAEWVPNRDPKNRISGTVRRISFFAELQQEAKQEIRFPFARWQEILNADGQVKCALEWVSRGACPKLNRQTFFVNFNLSSNPWM